MTVSVTMLQTRLGENGALWTAGSVYTATDAFAAFLITGNYATGSLPQPDQSTLTPAQVAAVQAMVSEGRLTAPFDLAARTAAILAAQGYTYYAPWTHDARPIVGSTVPTLTRASTATVVDYAGRMHFCLSGELRFRGARRAANLIADSESFVSGWTAAAAPVAAASSRQCIGTRRAAWSITRASGTGIILTLNSAAYRPGPYVFSIGIETDTAIALTIRMERSSDSAQVAELSTTTPAGGMRRYAISGTITDATNHRIKITCPTSGAATLIVNCAMLTYGDEVHEYVARGVAGAASPFDGAMVDGVKYFPYESGLSIGAGGVVADAGPGAAIDDAILAGVLVEARESKQQFYHSGDVGQASQWTHTGVTVGAQGSSTLLGNLGLRQITEDTSTGLHRIVQAWKSTSNDGRIKSVSFYVDPDTAARPRWVYVGFTPKGASPTDHICWFDIDNLVAGTISSAQAQYVTPYIYREGDLVRVGISAPGGTVAVAETEIGFLGFADADGSSSYTGASRNLWVGAAQFEESDCPSSYVIDTTTSVLTRANEDFDLTRLTVLPSAEWTMTLAAAMDQDPNAAGRTSWVYLVYWYLDGSNKGGVTLRRGEFSGGSAADRITWPMDYYFNSGTDTEIHTVSAVKQPRQRLKFAARMTRLAQGDTAQIAFSMDGDLSAVAAGHTSAAGAIISDTVISLRFGRSTTGYAGGIFRGTFRQFGVMGRAMTNAELVAATA